MTERHELAAEQATSATDGQNGRWRWVVGFVATLGLVLAGVFAGSAFWATLRPPLQDLPQHLAAARVLLDGKHPGFAFDSYFEVDWLRSQYLGTYVLIGAFFYPLRAFVDEPLLWACRCLLVLLAVAWPLSTELVYRKLRRPVGLGAFALVLFFNAHLVLGFLNFLLGIVACFTAMGCLAGARAGIRQRRAHGGYLAGWGVASLACFYLHVVPFALLVMLIGAAFAVERLWPAVVARWNSRRAPGVSAIARASCAPEWRPYWAFLPALLACGAWLFTPAGVSAREAARGAGARGRAVFSSVATNWEELPSWLMDSFASRWDTRWAAWALEVFVLWLVVEAVVALLARRSQRASPLDPHLDSAPDADRLLLWVLRCFVPLSFILYFALPSSYDWIWPINARFPLLGLLFLPLWSARGVSGPGRLPLRALRVVVVALGLVCSSGEALVARDAFAGFQRELGDFDAVLNQIPPGQRTAALIFDRFSRHVGFAPFLHLGAYYQAERGGVSFFNFADFPQSPIRFRPENRPPRVKPRWEWTPEVVRDKDLTWFDYVITRGGPGRIGSSRRFEAAGRWGAYRLFRARNATPSTPPVTNTP